jgi:hypothetical protein
MIADVALHAPGKEGDDRNHHAHVMLTMREMLGDGFGKKVRDWNGNDVLGEWREAWAVHQNRDLERYGHEARVDHRSYAERGVDREPTQHMGPTAHQMEQNGRPSRIGEENRERDARNAERADNRGEAVILHMDIDREKANFSKWAAKARYEVDAYLRHERLDLAQRHDRIRANHDLHLEKVYGEHKATLQTELSTVERRLEARGVRRFVRTALGRTAADRQQRVDLGRTVRSIEQREREERQKLDKKLALEVRAKARKQELRRERLEGGIKKVRGRREREGWIDPDLNRPPAIPANEKMPTQPDPANRNRPPAESQSKAAPEWTNTPAGPKADKSAAKTERPWWDKPEPRPRPAGARSWWDKAPAAKPEAASAGKRWWEKGRGASADRESAATKRQREEERRSWWEKGRSDTAGPDRSPRGWGADRSSDTDRSDDGERGDQPKDTKRDKGPGDDREPSR